MSGEEHRDENLLGSPVPSGDKTPLQTSSEKAEQADAQHLKAENDTRGNAAVEETAPGKTPVPKSQKASARHNSAPHSSSLAPHKPSSARQHGGAHSRPSARHSSSSDARTFPFFSKRPKSLTSPTFSSLRKGISVLVVTLASGLLFTISASLAKTAPHSDSDLIGLVRTSQAEVGALEEQVLGLKAEIDSYTKASEQPAATVPALASQAVRGPGVTITLTDAPPDSLARGAAPNDLVIHQQDIEDVMNALWNGGAEAMTVQDIRVTGRTVIRCIGNVILVDGDSFSPPYVIKAIGDPAQLRRKVDENPRIVNYKTYVTLYGLGWEMTTEDELRLPAASADSTNSYAQVVD
mgnify:FL=1